MSGVVVTRFCAECDAEVELEACPSCDGLADSCDECGGAGAVVDGEPVDDEDVLCAGCCALERLDATRDWVSM